jgi:hypothetical protein
MTLSDARREFTRMLADLLDWCQVNGYAVAIDMGKRCPDCKVGHPKSLHKLGLAADILLYQDMNRDGDLNDTEDYITNSSDYLPMGEYWERIGGSWGGRFNDGNHFSLEWNGMK